MTALCDGFGFHYSADLLSSHDEETLADFLRAVPVVRNERQDLQSMFAFAPARWEGRDLAGRKMAAAGNPIWIDEAPTRGVALPRPLAGLRDRVAEQLLTMNRPGSCQLDSRAIGDLTSVYVDWYEVGGELDWHVDRSCYGPVVAGVSVGPGTASLRFVRHDDPRSLRVFKIEPRSLYFFHGAARYEPWRHAVSVDGGSRFGITFRSGLVSGHSGSLRRDLRSDVTLDVT